MTTRDTNSRETLQQIKERMKASKSSRGEPLLTNVYEKAERANSIIRKRTGLCYDDQMVLHKCEWDNKYPENPQRYTAVLKRCKELGLLDRCVRLPNEIITGDKVMKKHTETMYEHFEYMQKLNLKQLESECTKYDAVYLNKDTFKCASIAAGCVLSLVENVCKETVQNGMAIVRPPGHHAMANDFCGYCFFNNVAIAAQYALDNDLAKKILIVDYDVHHGQGTQQMFYEDNRVLYFSIHRYQQGTFWPHLRESNFDYVGKGKGSGYNINFPLNSTGLNDMDYLAIVLHILMPVAYEYNPDLIIFSAGYDACIGCPEGEMRVTPGFYGHLIKLLGGLANGKLAVCMEGGYFIPSLSEGVAMTIKSLLDDPPAVLDTSTEVNEYVIQIINSLKMTLNPHWKCFQANVFYDVVRGEEYHEVIVNYLGAPLRPPYLTRNCYVVKSNMSIRVDTEIIEQLKEEYAKIKTGGVCYSYDDIMLLHESSGPHPENPLRLKKLYDMFVEIKLHERCERVPCKEVDIDTIKLVHDGNYIDSLVNRTYVPQNTDIYFKPDSIKSILTSVGCLLGVVDSVMTGSSRSGAALIRPPGHHAEYDDAEGFCFICNVAVAAKYILKNYNVKRILILDFDIHHGNGTQSAFYDSKEVLYISIHKYNYGKFFPYQRDAEYDQVGSGAGEGFNVNIPLNKSKMGDIDYMSIFYRVVLPIAYSYSPEVVIVSAGFDAGVKDTIGNYMVTPEAFGHFVQLLRPLAEGKLILALEGGYNGNTLAHSMNMCVKALLGDPLPTLSLETSNITTVTTIENVISCQKKYWPIFNVERKLKKIDLLTTALQRISISE